MSKFEPIPLDTLPCCACCKHLDRSVVYTSNPPKFMCKLFHDYVTGDRRTCLEDNPKRTVPPQEQRAWTTNDLVNRLHDFTQKAVYEGVRGGGGSFLPPEGYINGKEREIRARLGRIEKRLKEQGEKKNGIDKRVDRLEAVVNSYDAKIAKLDERLMSLAIIVKQLDLRRDLMWVVAERKIYFLTNAVLHKELNGEDWVEGMEDGITKITLCKKFRIFSSRARAEEYLREELSPTNYKNYADKIEPMYYTQTTPEEKKCQQ